MLSRLTLLTSITTLALTACATQQENPFYKYSSKYKGGTTTTVTQAGSVIQTAPVSYEAASHPSVQSVSYSQSHHDCLRKEKNHELIGASIGGAVGAIAGKELIGGTKGTVIGAGLGGAAGYGIGDKVVNCDPEPAPVQQVTNGSYQSYPSAPTVPATYAAPVFDAPVLSPTDTEFSAISEIGTPGYQVLQAQSVSTSEQPAMLHGSTLASSNKAQEVVYNYEANTITASAATSPLVSETRTIGRSHNGSHIVQEGDTVYSLSRKLCVGLADIQSLNGLDASYGIKIGDTLQLPASNC